MLSAAGFLLLVGFVGEKNCNLVDIWNFIRCIEPSGFLIFAGIAAGLTYAKHSLIFYRNATFITGFFFALIQSAIAGMAAIPPCSKLSGLEYFWLGLTVISGIGFVIFSIVAMAVYEHEKKDSHAGNEIDGKEAKDLHINLNLSLKNDSAQPSPAPADLAHDLQYSRSHSRRSQEQR